MLRACVIGHPVGHSLSPTMHNAAFGAFGIDAVYEAANVAPQDLAEFLAGVREPDWLGVNITVPHKQAAVDLCDELNASATGVGAVNCIVARGGQLVGHNTDSAGFLRALGTELGLPLAGQQVVILGTGGSARAVHAGVIAEGATVTVVTRSPGRSRAWPQRLVGWETLSDVLSSCQLLVDCTPVGLGDGHSYPTDIPIDQLPGSSAVVSLIYHRRPRLLVQAEQAGLATMDGAEMLIQQAGLSFQLWTQKPAPVEAMRKAFRAGLV